MPEVPIDADADAQPPQHVAANEIPIDAAPSTKEVPIDHPPDTSGPMPGFFRALGQGAVESFGGVKSGVQTLEGQKPEVQPETSPAAQPLEWGDVPSGNIFPKIGYQLGKGWPTMAAGVAGGAAGTAIAGPVGGIVGGIGGAGVGAVAQEIGPLFAQELKQSPSDPDGAWTRALHQAEVSGAFSGASWALFPWGRAMGPLKQMMFQAFGVQPAVGMAEQATQNVMQGKPATENLGQSYAQSALGTVVPAAGHALLSAALPPREPAPKPSARPPEPPKPAEPPTTEPTFADLYPKDSMKPVYQEIDMKLPTPPGGTDPTRQDAGFVQRQFNKIADTWKRNFQPEQLNNTTLDNEGFFREYGSMSAQGQDSTYHALTAAHYAGERLQVDPQAAINFMKYAAKEPTPPGYTPPDYLLPHLDVARDLMKWVKQADNEVGFEYGDKGDYFPRQYKPRDRDSATQMFVKRSPTSMERPGFQKARTLDLLQDGLDQGLQLVSNNPFDLIANRLIASSEARARIKLLGRLNESRVAQPLDSAGKEAQAQYAGWHIIKNPLGEKWGVHPDLKPMWESVMQNKGLWSDPGMTGDIFKKWMKMKNFYVPVKLMASGFHPLHVAHIDFMNGMTRGFRQLLSGHPLQSINSILKSFPVIGYGQLANALPGVKTGAKFAREAWLTPEWKQTPEQKAVVNTMAEGGFSPQLSEQLRTYDSRAWRDAWINSNYLKALPYGARQLFINTFQKPVFEHWIPSLKTAAYLDEAKALFQRRPDLLADDTLRRAALGAIAKSVDNRYGEMFYRNLFWNKTAKDVGIGSFLSLGWNLGFAREFGGGILEPFLKNVVEQTPTREAISAAKNKFTFSLVYMGSAMMLNALMTKLMSGEDPEGMDYFLPRIGGTNPDSSPRRVTNMFYSREIPMLEKHVEEQQSYLGGLKSMLWNKMMFEPFKEMFENRDYYGYNIMNEGSPWYQRAYQLGKYVISDQFNPITVLGAKRALQATGKWNEDDSFITKAQKIATNTESQLAMAGFGPAPTYAAKSGTVNRLTYLFERYVPPAERPQADREMMEKRHDAQMALAGAKQRGDTAAATEAAQRLAVLLGKAPKKTTQAPDVYMFTRLPESVKKEFLVDLPKEDFKKYWPAASKPSRAQLMRDPEIQGLLKKYYQ